MQEGWKCPQCGQVNAPWKSHCDGCKPYYFPFPTTPDWPCVPNPYDSNPSPIYPWYEYTVTCNEPPNWYSDSCSNEDEK